MGYRDLTLSEAMRPPSLDAYSYLFSQVVDKICADINDVLGQQNITTPLALDCFSGCGWGSFMIAHQTGCFVTGVDGDEQNNAWSNRYFKHPKVLQAKSVFHFMLPPEAFHFVLSMESLEHLPASLAGAFIEQLAGAVKPGGCLYLTVPDASTVNLERDLWPFHFKYFAPSEIIGIVEGLGLELKDWWGVPQNAEERNVVNGLPQITRTMGPSEVALQRRQSGWTNLYAFRRP